MTKIFWVGDSTVQFNDYSTYPQTGIGQVFELFLRPSVKVENHAVNGRSTKSFIDELRLDKVCDSIRAGDFLFIQFGHNDEKEEDPSRYTRPEIEFSENLGKFANAARDKNAHPVFITPLTRRCFNDDGTLKKGEHLPYVNAMRATAERISVPLIDLYSMSRELIESAGLETTKEWYMHLPEGKYKNYPEGLTDNSHLKYAGAVTFGSLIAKGLKELGGIYGELISDDVAPIL